MYSQYFLKRLLQDKDFELLQTMGSAVELLDVMLEETSPESDAIKQGLKEAINVDNLLQALAYFHKMSRNKQVMEKKMDDDAKRGMFRSYHVLVALADSEFKIGKKTIGKIKVQLNINIGLH